MVSTRRVPTYMLSYLHCSANKLKFNLNMYQLRENKKMKPKVFMGLVSSVLYERR